MADLTREEPAIVLAIALAAFSSVAPETCTSIRQVAPSPSRAIALAKYWHTAVSIASNVSASAPISVIAGVRDWPLAKAIRESLVLVSPSTVIWLKLRSAARLNICCHREGETAASQVTKASIVAMLGWIIPEPLAIPPMRTGRSPIVVSKAIDLVTKSVVIMACAAASDPVSEAAAISWGMALRIASMRMRWPITPVEASNTDSAGKLSACPSNIAHSKASSQPWEPVAALACPALQRIALALALACSLWRQ